MRKWRNEHHLHLCAAGNRRGDHGKTEEIESVQKAELYMRNNEKVMRRRRVGELSSKYAYDYDGGQFEADMKAHKERAEYLWSEFVDFMKSHDVDPKELRTMFTRYYEEFIK